MSIYIKLRPGNSELTKLKAVWRRMSEDDRGYWRELFVSQQSRADTRKEIAAKLKCSLGCDNQLFRFRKWLPEQDAREAEEELATQDEQELQAEHPEWDSQRLRQELLDRMKRRALKQGDFKLGLQVIAQDVKVESLAFDKEKFKEGLRTKLQSGLMELGQYIKDNPEAKAAYEALRATVTDSTK